MGATPALSLIHILSYEKQLEFKRNKVQNHLSRIGGLTDVVVLPVIGMEFPWRYRNKAQIPVCLLYTSRCV